MAAHLAEQLQRSHVLYHKALDERMAELAAQVWRETIAWPYDQWERKAAEDVKSTGFVWNDGDDMKTTLITRCNVTARVDAALKVITTGEAARFYDDVVDTLEWALIKVIGDKKFRVNVRIIEDDAPVTVRVIIAFDCVHKEISK